MDLILASTSPRRRKLLLDVGYDFPVVDPQFNEDTIKASSPEKFVCDLATAKANAAYETLPDITKLGSVVLSADTVVSFNGEILGKPHNDDEAYRMLKKLSGNMHEVYTGVCLLSTVDSDTFYVKTDVFFDELTDEEIFDYIKTGEPFDKAGAYGIQGRGSILVKKIDGDFYNVVGLPVSKVVKKLRKYGVRPKLNWQNTY